MGTDGAARITFVGDIMCEKPLQRAWNKGGDAVFDRVFSRTGALFAASDYVVGNLETVFAGPARGYTRELYRFNTPDGFARAIAKGGIHLLTTATNHCLDGGVEGLDRTLTVLDRCGLAHTGTFRSPAEPRFLVRRIGGLRVAFLNYTYGVNVHETGVVLPPQDLYRLNLLKPQTLRLQRYVGTPAGTFRRRVSSGLRRFTSDETRVRLKRLLRMPYYAVRVDDIDEGEPYRAYLPALLADLTEARRNADCVIACLHCGGQFHPSPGGLSAFYAAFFAENGADAVVCHHAHVVQPLSMFGRVPVAYCLGNYSVSPSSVYLPPEHQPDCSVALHLTLTASGVTDVSYSVLKTVEERGVPVTWPADTLYETLGPRDREILLREVDAVRKRFCGHRCEDAPPRREYKL